MTERVCKMKGRVKDNARSRRIAIILTTEITARAFYTGFLRYLVASGWDVFLLTSETKDLDEYSQMTGVSAIGVRLSREPSPIRDTFALFELLKLLIEIRPGIVVAATPKAGLLGLLAARIARIPRRVYLLWGLRYETMHGLPRRMFIALEVLQSRLATITFPNSDSLAEVARGIGMKRVQTLGPGSSHGVNLERFRPRRAGETKIPSLALAEFLQRNKGKLIVGFFGRITRDKGIDTLVAACKAVQDEVALVVVGAVEDDALAQEIQIAARTSQVILLGETDSVAAYLQLVDLICLPSLREGFPNIVLEASASGKPAIVSDATGVKDSVLDGQTGIIFPTGDINRLAAVLSECAKSPEKVLQLGREARKHVASVFDEKDIWRIQAEGITGEQADRSE